MPVHDDKVLFEFIILEGAQAGLNWFTVLQKREGYRELFKDFDPLKVAAMKDEELEELRNDSRIIRNKLKIYSARNNAKVFLDIQKEFGSFDKFVWEYVDYEPIKSHLMTIEEFPATTDISDKLSKELKRRGMKFVGSTIMYAYMQAVGMVDDHAEDCWIRNTK